MQKWATKTKFSNEANENVVDAYLLRLIAGVESVPGKLKHPLGITMRWFPCAALEPPCDIKSDKWAA